MRPVINLVRVDGGRVVFFYLVVGVLYHFPSYSGLIVVLIHLGLAAELIFLKCTTIYQD